MKPEELINWGRGVGYWLALAKPFGEIVFRKKHIPITNELIEAIQSVIDKIEPKYDAVSQNER